MSHAPDVVHMPTYNTGCEESVRGPMTNSQCLRFVRIQWCVMLQGWRVSATGVVLGAEAAPTIVKKLKLVGTPSKVCTPSLQWKKFGH